MSHRLPSAEYKLRNAAAQATRATGPRALQVATRARMLLDECEQRQGQQQRQQKPRGARNRSTPLEDYYEQLLEKLDSEHFWPADVEALAHMELGQHWRLPELFWPPTHCLFGCNCKLGSRCHLVHPYEPVSLAGERDTRNKFWNSLCCVHGVKCMQVCGRNRKGGEECRKSHPASTKVQEGIELGEYVLYHKYGSAAGEHECELTEATAFFAEVYEQVSAAVEEAKRPSHPSVRSPTATVSPATSTSTVAAAAASVATTPASASAATSQLTAEHDDDDCDDDDGDGDDDEEYDDDDEEEEYDDEDAEASVEIVTGVVQDVLANASAAERIEQLSLQLRQMQQQLAVVLASSTKKSDAGESFAASQRLLRDIGILAPTDDRENSVGVRPNRINFTAEAARNMLGTQCSPEDDVSDDGVVDAYAKVLGNLVAGLMQLVPARYTAIYPPAFLFDGIQPSAGPAWELAQAGFALVFQVSASIYLMMLPDLKNAGHLLVPDWGVLTTTSLLGTALIAALTQPALCHPSPSVMERAVFQGRQRLLSVFVPAPFDIATPAAVVRYLPQLPVVGCVEQAAGSDFASICLDMYNGMRTVVPTWSVDEDGERGCITLAHVMPVVMPSGELSAGLVVCTFDAANSCYRVQPHASDAEARAYLTLRLV